MKKIILFTIFILTCCFVSAETFEYTPNFPDLYTAREVALADSYVADYSTYFSVWSNPANAGITGNKIMLPFISLDMYSDFAKSIPFIVSSFDSTPEGIAEYITQNGTAPLNMNITGPLCIGAIKNNFFWGIFNNTYSTIDIEDATKGLVAGGEQTIFTAGYAYPIKLPLKSVISIGLSGKTFVDIQGIQQENSAEALIALKKLDFTNYPLFSTFGFGFDTGITISLFDIVTASASWNNFFAGTYSQKYDNMTEFKSFNKKYDTKANMPLEDNLIIGAAIKFPMDNLTKGLISKFNVYANFNNFLILFDKSEDGSPNPEEIKFMDYFTFGTEIDLLNTICLRVGLNSEDLSFGAGLKLGVIKLDVALYSKAWGIKKLDTSEMGISFSLGTYK